MHPQWKAQESKISLCLYQAFTEYRRNTRKRNHYFTLCFDVLVNSGLLVLCRQSPQVIPKTIYLWKMFRSSTYITYRVGLLVCRFSTCGVWKEDGLKPKLCTLSFLRKDKQTHLGCHSNTIRVPPVFSKGTGGCVRRLSGKQRVSLLRLSTGPPNDPTGLSLTWREKGTFPNNWPWPGTIKWRCDDGKKNHLSHNTEGENHDESEKKHRKMPKELL